jgi:hypothetical protein
MVQLRGTLSVFPLPAVLHLLHELGATGGLRISQAAWEGEIVLHGGQIVGAHLGQEHGRAALEGMVLALVDGEFVFADAVVHSAGEPLLAPGQVTDDLARLAVERERLLALRGALQHVPRLVEHPPAPSPAERVTVEAAALSLIPCLVHGWTLERVAQQRGVARTLRETAALYAAGLVRLAPIPSPEPVPAPPPRAVRPVPSAIAQHHRSQWQTQGLARAVDERPRQHPAPRPTPGRDPTSGRAQGWRTALARWFIAEASAPAPPTC